ncbi:MULTISPECIES: glycosyltransferase family 4 protein [Micromonospora]|uniref:Glycosyltransferase family 4 protein n=1 Tax=Micromonospora zamorensis TaxID=709883 RepID=A0ABZ1PQH2_9ACTN|nr:MULTISPECIES: glycosyltransferase family 4 protein [Micromonospora]MBQ0976958.1 glycosyltransferase family 4 protein [Micromonospora sp. M61]WSK47689.1 glycosyltransferase family 4 protein [Micromonospora zamorensis]WTE89604.1 glycosyltransferase family 4 protein [Micromonospora zamorensis]WTI24384.1 glycosyltransferase family 4 protein [Micromonospora zamorensis]
MRIGLISQWYPPEGVFIPGNLARQLAGRGHEVKVLTTFPSYPYGRVFPGWQQRWRHRETEGPVMVRRVPAYPSHDTSTVRRALSHLSFGATSAVAGARWLADVDVTYVYHPPPTAVAAAALQRAARRTPIVLHVQDLWPESVTQSGMAPTGRVGRWLERSIGALMRGTYRLADAIVVISPTMAERVVAGGADPDRVRVVWNWTDDALFRPVPVTDEARAVLGHRQRCTVMFAGNLGLLQGIETAIRAAAAASDRMDLVLVGSGAGEDGARRLAADLGADNVRFIGRRPPEQMAELYAAAQWQLLCLRDVPALRAAVPSKLQAALACGVPVIAAAGGDTGALVRSAGVGLVCPPEDWRALAERFVEASDQPAATRQAMADRARQVYRDRMSLRVGVDQFEDILTKVAAQRGRA